MSTAIKKTEPDAALWRKRTYNVLALAIIGVGIVLFYALKLNIWLKWGVVLFTTVAAVAVFMFLSPTGLSLHRYFKDVWIELGKVVWPSRKEATQFTWIVFLFVVVLALFLWLVDSSLSWLLYSVILGKGH